MTFRSILEKGDGRILGWRIVPEGFEIAICVERANGALEPVSGTKTVLIARATRRWIAHALHILQWDETDLLKVCAFLMDPRLMMPRDHDLHRFTLALPDHIAPQDRYLQLASVWAIEGPRFAACITDMANNPAKWGAQVAALMEKLVMEHLDTAFERKSGLDILGEFYREALTVREYANPAFATRYDWAETEQGMEIIAVWASTLPGNPPILLTSRNAFSRTALWGVAIAALTDEIIDTLATECDVEHQTVFEALTEAFEAGLTQARARIESDSATLH